MKTVTSPVKRFPGTVGLKDPLPLDACILWEAAIQDCNPKTCPTGREILLPFFALDKDDERRAEIVTAYNQHFYACVESENIPRCKPGKTEIQAQARLLPAVKACVESWGIEGFDLSNPPGSPKAARSELIGWIIGEVNKLYLGEEPDPNA